MKKNMRIITVLVLTTLLFGCNTQEKKLDGFIIKGNVKNLNNSKLLVLKFVNGGIEVDSISVVNNKFEYSGKVKEPYFIQLLIKYGKSTKGKLTEFMVENSEIHIEGNSIEYDSIKVSGSQSDKILKEYLEKDEVLNSKWDLLKKEYDKYVESNDSINRESPSFQDYFKLKITTTLRQSKTIQCLRHKIMISFYLQTIYGFYPTFFAFI